MATISDERFMIRVVPSWCNWWTYRFEFFFNDIPVFNPLLTKDGVFEADEYDQGWFLHVLEKALSNEIDEKGIGWEAWDTEMGFDLIPYVRRSSLGDFELFDFRIAIGQACLKDAELIYGFQNLGVNISVSREDLNAFYQELKKEMLLNSPEHAVYDPNEK